MNSENSKTSKPHVLILKLTNKLDLRIGEKVIALSNLSIYYTWKNIKSSYNNNKFKISTPTWNDEFKLPDGSGGTGARALIISNDEMEDMMKIVKSLEESGLSLKRVGETIQKEVKEQKGGFVSLLLCTLDCSLLENLLTGNGTIRVDGG